MRNAGKIQNALAECHPLELTDKEVWDWQRQWRHTYARQLHAETGKWVRNKLDWHVFSFDKYVHAHGDAAWARYRLVEPGPFVVVSADADLTFGFRSTGQPPDALDLGIDILVASTSMAWTMAFNHERMGPYFAVAR